MKYTITDKGLLLEVEGQEDEEFLLDSLLERSEMEALADLCDGHTGWLGNQGPQPRPAGDSHGAPALAMDVDYDDNGIPRWRSSYEFQSFNRIDWRTTLWQEGLVLFHKV